MQLFNAPVFAAVTLPATGPVYSAAIKADYLISATVQGKFSDATAGGTLKLQCSNDPTNTPTAVSNWSDIPGATSTVTAGALTMTPILSAPYCYKWIRAAFVATAGTGTGTLTANLEGMSYQ